MHYLVKVRTRQGGNTTWTTPRDKTAKHDRGAASRWISIWPVPCSGPCRVQVTRGYGDRLLTRRQMAGPGPAQSGHFLPPNPSRPTVSNMQAQGRPDTRTIQTEKKGGREPKAEKTTIVIIGVRRWRGRYSIAVLYTLRYRPLPVTQY